MQLFVPISERDMEYDILFGFFSRHFSTDFGDNFNIMPLFFNVRIFFFITHTI